ncbi:acyl-CoA dehydrogenase family member 9, mitochondrial-like [Lingula anatina]|uniref:Acyl-CoA dehydrogenase family member 9, mitochondrial-like n=1 Tax=Lingula anatina TaxID=7574 RepID=A0A1S3H6P3_LINAN|nr:acyl-CoA dehydrogenase family member 9, mitochondrial-like [Lingula anatina]|eukprot:XP_013380799.1 acyl-CoA dehydrogenase family member 9, mitochondrial-like [Lingula anatina]
MLSKHVLNCRHLGRKSILKYTQAKCHLKDMKCAFSQSKTLTNTGNSAETFPDVTSTNTSDGTSELQRAFEDRAHKNKLPFNEKPFVKNLFSGVLSKEVFTFPQIGHKEDLEVLDRLIKPVEDLFKESVHSGAIDRDAEIPEKIITQLKELGLFGLEVPREYGGLDLSVTESAQFAEVTGADCSISMTLAAHHGLGLKSILLSGNEEQKAKYLPKLATGESIAAFCLSEPDCGSDISSIETTARLTEEGSSKVVLNGTKNWVVNGGIADVFIVIAKGKFKNEQNNTFEKLVALIVEKDFGGVTVSEPHDTLGTRGCNTCTVHFDNTPVPVENSLGELGEGQEFALRILECGRVGVGAAAVSLLKNLLASVVQAAISRTRFGKKLCEFDLIKERVAKITETIYAMESITYHTAGLMDTYEEPDTGLEAAILKIFSSEGVFTCVDECLHILGAEGYLRDQPYEQYLRDARMMAGFPGTNDVTRLFIALRGIQHASKDLQGFFKTLKDPFNSLTQFIKKAKPDFKTLKVEEVVLPIFKGTIKLAWSLYLTMC